MPYWGLPEGSIEASLGPPSPYTVTIVMIFFEELAIMIPFLFIFMLFVLPQIRFCLCKAQSFQRNAPFISTEQARNLTEHFIT